MSREAVHSLRWCSLAPGAAVLSGALWMPLGNLGLAYRSDYPVKDRPHTFALPSIYRRDMHIDQ
jgi:hypothetical protein